MSSSSAPGRPRRDASMSLLHQVTDTALDPAYAEVASRRTAHSAWRRSVPTAVSAIVVGLLLGAGGASLRGSTAPGGAYDTRHRTDLVERVESGRAAVEDRTAEVTRLQREIASLTADGGRASGAGTVDAAVVLASAEQPVEGPGVVVTLDDSRGAPAAGEDPREREDRDDTIEAADLQLLVNDLWAAGAEAVDVNGHRLGSTTSIRFAGEALVVAHRPLARPYVVSAVGGPPVRQSAREGAVARRLAEVGHRRNVRTQVREEGRLHLPAAAVLAPRSARPDAAASHPSAPDPTKVVP